jgi:hypothetical protein
LVYADTRGRAGAAPREGLGHRGGAERRAGALLARGLRPMIVAGEPSTGPFRDRDIGCARPTGVDMVSPLTIQRNASRAQSEGRAREGYPKCAAKGIIEAGVRKPRPDLRS